MKKILLLCLTTLISGATWAYNFYSESTGTRIYYNTLSADNYTTVEVTYASSSYNSYSGSVVVPDSVYNGTNGYKVVGIGNYAFKDCTGLTSVELPSTITYLGQQAFDYCSGLTKVDIPEAVTYIDRWAFEYCTGLTEVEIPKNVTEIRQSAFYYCTSLKEITVPDNVTTLGTYAFCGCSKLEKAVVGDGLTILDQQVFDRCDNLKDVTLGKNITSIGKWAFEYDYALEYITLPESVTEILQSAFYYCTSLKEITIPDAVTTLGTYVFEGCSALEKVVIGNGVTTIDQETFCFCSALKDVTFGNNVATIGKWAFYQCYALEELNFPESLNNIVWGAFMYCNKLTELEFPDNMTAVEEYAFEYCDALKKVIIGNACTTIGQEAFCFCYAMEDVIIGKGVTSLGSYAFYDNTSLKSFVSLNTTPPTCATQVFYNIPSTCPLFVPEEAVGDYSSASTWKDFYTITELIPTTLIPLESTDVTDKSAVIVGTTAEGSLPVRERGFEFWLDADDVETIVSDVTEDGEFTAEVSDLAYGTTYTYRVYAVTLNGEEYSEERTFTTETYAPEVKTLAATEVTDVSAVLNGTVEQGSEPITKKGFEYWKNSSSNVKTSLTVTTEEMTYTLENLTPETAYTYRSYAVTDSGYVYGDEITFTTDVPTGLSRIALDTENVEGYYTTSGQKLAAPQKGVNIVRYADGTTKKVLIK